MQLVSLKVFQNNEVIREVTFKSGINIITNKGKNGNQIGKSTVLRAISFCLGSDAQYLWKDPENKSENLEVKDLILNKNVIFELKLKGSLPHTIKRRVYQQQQKNRTQIKTEGWINGAHVTSVKSYKAEIAKSVFNYNQKTPSFNTVRSKFTRINRLTSNNSLKYLDVHTSDSEYTIIYSTIFGFAGLDYLKKEITINADIDKKTKRVDAILNGKDLIEISDAIKNIDTQIEHYNSEDNEIDLTALQSKAIEKIRNFRKSIASISSEIAALETRLIYNNRTIERYIENQVSIDIEMVSAIYNEAIGYIPTVSKSLEETILFHNSIFLEKAKQSQNRSLTLNKELELSKEILVDLVESERKSIKELSSEGQLNGLLIVEKEIQSLNENRGRLAYVLDEVKLLNREIRHLNIERQKVKDRVELLISGLKNNINDFNFFFSKLTRNLFKKHANSLNVDIDENNNVRYSIVNASKNTGDGTPRAEAIAFDISLVEYIRTINKRLPNFTLQDYLESVDEDKLWFLFSYAEKNKVQVIASILNDKLKLMPAEFLIDNTILELSSTNKFFKL